MKAAYLTEAKTFELRDAANPAVPDDGLILEVRACGICGSDIRRWNEGPPAGSGGVVPGHEAAGVVVEVGSRYDYFQVGDRLAIAPDVHCGRCYYCRRGMYNLCDELHCVGITPGYPGGFAERMVLTGRILTNGIVHKMPDGLSFEHAAVSELCCSVLSTHNRAGAGPGDTVVVLGAGPAGCLLAAIAKRRGARTVICEPTAARREMVGRFELDLVIDPASQDATEAVKEFTKGVGADVVICANPVAQTQTQAVEMVRKAGKVFLFGGLPKADPMTTVDSNVIHYGEIEVIGAFSYHPTMHELALDLLSQGSIPAESLITHKFDLTQINEAYEAASSGTALKVLITIEKEVS